MHTFFSCIENHYRTEKPALLSANGATVGWDELLERGQRFAATLPAPEMEGAIAILATERHREFLVGLLGAWAAGYSVFPVAAWKGTEVESLRREIPAPSLLLLGEGSRVNQSSLEASWLLKATPIECDSRKTMPIAAIPGNRLALLLATSGSTAAPRILGFRHQDLFAAAAIDLPGLQGVQSILNLRPLYTSGGTNTLWASLRYGLTTALSTRATSLPHIDSLRAIETDLIVASPSWLRTMMLTLKEEDKLKPSQLFFGGARLREEELSRLRNAGLSPFMRYGFTECAHVLSLVDHTVPNSIEINNIGPILPGIEWRIEDGFLAVSSPGMASSCFRGGRENELCETSWYRSDDKVNVNPKGELLLNGREYEQILSAGFRFTPVEIEEEIMRTGLVADCAVTALPDALYGQRAAALVVQAPGQDPLTLPFLLERELSTRLSAYKLPVRIVVTSQLPRSPSGKRIESRVRKLIRLAKPQGR